MEVAREVEVHVLHRNDLRVTATSRATLHPEVRPEGRFADTDRSFLTDTVQTIAQTYGGGGLTFARRGRVDRSDEDQFTVLARFNFFDKTRRDFRLIVTVRDQIRRIDTEDRTDLLDRFLVCLASNLNISLKSHGTFLFPVICGKAIARGRGATMRFRPIQP